MSRDDEATRSPVVGEIEAYREFDPLAGEVEVPMGFAAYPRESFPSVDPLRSWLWTADIVVFSLCSSVGLFLVLGGIAWLAIGTSSWVFGLASVFVGAALLYSGWRAVYQWRLGWLILGVCVLLFMILVGLFGSMIFPTAEEDAGQTDGVFPTVWLLVGCPAVYALGRFALWNASSSHKLRLGFLRSGQRKGEPR